MRTGVSGPVIIYGNDNPQQISDTDSGPNIDYQSNALGDSRYISQMTAAGEGSNAGIYAFHNPVEIEALNYVPYAASATNIAAAQSPTVGGFFTLASANSAGVAVNIPLIPQLAPSSTNAQYAQPNASNPQPIVPGSTNLVNVLALDYGFAFGTAVAGSPTITLTGPAPSNYTGTATYGTRFLYPGQKLLVAGAGNVGGTLTLACSVLATDRYSAPGVPLAAAGTITLSTPSLFTGTVYLGTADQEYGIAVKPVIRAGAVRLYDPAQMGTRCVICTASGASTGTITIRGYDIYEQPMSETQTIVGTGVTVPKKAFGYISSVQLNTGAVLAGTLSLGTNQQIGLPIRTDIWEACGLWVNQAQIAAPTNVVFADQTSPATSTTGDVRGTYTLQTVAGNTNRVAFYYQAPAAQAVRATNIDFRTLVGTPNA
jgi:hypothetical protein